MTHTYPIFKNQLDKLAIYLWLLGFVMLLVANQHYFPNSKFSELTELILFNQFAAKVCFLILSIPIIGVLLLVCWAFIRYISLHLSMLVALVSMLLISIFLYTTYQSQIQFIASASQPNVIIIGIDSLRPDYLSFFGADKKTPFFDSFLSQATVFSDAVTPLARTFPSWTGILSGKYPKEIGIRFNLASQANINLQDTLPAILQRHGYKTIFATDETRFSNIDRNFGFDKIISPPVGLNDFLIGTFNDFPLSNLVINTTLGHWLFPYSYANRPIYFAYHPNSFLKLIFSELHPTPKQPVMLAVHFCLPHNPYLWATLPGNDYNPWQRYEASIHRVDSQINALVRQLQQQHFLDHAIVILLSDHGEGLELPGDRITENELYVTKSTTIKTVPKFYLTSLDPESVNQSTGHGTDVLGLSQYHSLLAFKTFGMRPLQANLVPGVVSLLDIKATVLDLLGLPPVVSSGISLAKFMQQHNHQTVPLRHIYLESDFTPEAIRTVYPETRQVMLEGIQLFEIDPVSTRLTVKTSMGQMIIASKQFADIYGDWILALYPQNKTQRMPILVNLRTGQWTNDLLTPFAQHSPAQKMLLQLRTFYGSEIAAVH